MWSVVQAEEFLPRSVVIVAPSSLNLPERRSRLRQFAAVRYHSDTVVSWL